MYLLVMFKILYFNKCRRDIKFMNRDLGIWQFFHKKIKIRSYLTFANYLKKITPLFNKPFSMYEIFHLS